MVKKVRKIRYFNLIITLILLLFLTGCTEQEGGFFSKLFGGFTTKAIEERIEARVTTQNEFTVDTKLGKIESTGSVTYENINESLTSDIYKEKEKIKMVRDWIINGFLIGFGILIWIGVIFFIRYRVHIWKIKEENFKKKK